MAASYDHQRSDETLHIRQACRQLRSSHLTLLQK